MQDIAISTVAHVIQMAVAPVFLLTGIGAMLAVMTQRLARVMDRARELDEQVQQADQGLALHPPDYAARISRLQKRAISVSRAILLCTVTALFICLVIVVLFLAAWFGFDTALPVSILFISAMLTFIAGLLAFLREVFLALGGLELGKS